MIVLFFRSPSRLSRFIRWVTHSQYSHVAVMVDNCLYEALGNGVVRSCREDGWLRARAAAAVSVLPLDGSDQRQVKRWLEAQLGHPYSLLGFVAAGMASVGIVKRPLVLSLKGEYVCSGLVATALQIGGYLPDVDARLETPASIAAALEPETTLWP